MLKYQVHYEQPDEFVKGIIRSSRSVVARTEREAIAKLRQMVPDSFGHWINGNATEGLLRTASPVQHGDEHKLERSLDKLAGDFLVYAELDDASEAIQEFIHTLQGLDDMAREKQEKEDDLREHDGNATELV